MNLIPRKVVFLWNTIFNRREQRSLENAEQFAAGLTRPIDKQVGQVWGEVWSRHDVPAPGHRRRRP